MFRVLDKVLGENYMDRKPITEDDLSDSVDILQKLDEQLEESIRDITKKVILESEVMSADEKIEKITKLEDFQISDEDKSQFLKEVIDPIVSATGIVYTESESPLVLNPLMYEVCLALELIRRKEYDGIKGLIEMSGYKVDEDLEQERYGSKYLSILFREHDMTNKGINKEIVESCKRYVTENDVSNIVCDPVSLIEVGGGEELSEAGENWLVKQNRLRKERKEQAKQKADWEKQAKDQAESNEKPVTKNPVPSGPKTAGEEEGASEAQRRAQLDAENKAQDAADQAELERQGSVLASDSPKTSLKSKVVGQSIVTKDEILKKAAAARKWIGSKLAGWFGDEAKNKLSAIFTNKRIGLGLGAATLGTIGLLAWKKWRDGKKVANLIASLRKNCEVSKNPQQCQKDVDKIAQQYREKGSAASNAA